MIVETHQVHQVNQGHIPMMSQCHWKIHSKNQHQFSMGWVKIQKLNCGSIVALWAPFGANNRVGYQADFYYIKISSSSYSPLSFSRSLRRFLSFSSVCDVNIWLNIIICWRICQSSAIWYQEYCQSLEIMFRKTWEILHKKSVLIIRGHFVRLFFDKI